MSTVEESEPDSGTGEEGAEMDTTSEVPAGEDGDENEEEEAYTESES